MTIDERDRVVPITTRRWPGRRRSWRRWLITAGAAVLVAVLVWLVFFSTVLGLQTVQVKGAADVSSQQIVAAARIEPGTPLARIDLAAIQARVEAIRAIASASVSRSWPHEVVVTVTERQPIAVVRRDDAWWVMDKEAVLFAKAGPLAPEQTVVELDGNPGPGTLPAVASVLASLPPALLTATGRVTASSMDSITLHLKNGSEVRWGSASDSSQKAAVLTALLHHKAEIYDVAIPSQPATIGQHQ